MITVSVDTKELDRLRKLLRGIPGGMRKACDAGVKEAAKAVKSAISSEVPRQYNVKASRVKRAVTVKGGKSQGIVLVRGQRMNLIEFHVSPRRVKNPQHGLTVSVRKDTGMKRLMHGFLMRGGGGKTIVMERVGRGRKAIRSLSSLAVPQMMSHPAVEERISEDVSRAVIEGMRIFAGRILTGGK